MAEENELFGEIEETYMPRMNELVSLAGEDVKEKGNLERIGLRAVWFGEKEYVFGETYQKVQFEKECLQEIGKIGSVVRGFNERKAKEVLDALYGLGVEIGATKREMERGYENTKKSVLSIGKGDIVRCKGEGWGVHDWKVNALGRANSGKIILSLGSIDPNSGEAAQIRVDPFGYIFCVKANGGNTIIDNDRIADKERVARYSGKGDGVFAGKGKETTGTYYITASYKEDSFGRKRSDVRVVSMSDEECAKFMEEGRVLGEQRVLGTKYGGLEEAYSDALDMINVSKHNNYMQVYDCVHIMPESKEVIFQKNEDMRKGAELRGQLEYIVLKDSANGTSKSWEFVDKKGLEPYEQMDFDERKEKGVRIIWGGDKTDAVTKMLGTLENIRIYDNEKFALDVDKAREWARPYLGKETAEKNELPCVSYETQGVSMEERAKKEIPLFLLLQYGFCDSVKIPGKDVNIEDTNLYKISYKDSKEAPYGLYEVRNGLHGSQQHSLWNFKKDFTFAEAVSFVKQFREYEQTQSVKEKVMVEKKEKKERMGAR